MKHIYVIDNGHGVVKIGVAKNVADRVTTIARQGGFNPANVYHTEKCSNSYELEAYIHKQLNRFRTRGEWFEMDFGYAVKVVKDFFRENAEFEEEKEKCPLASECTICGLSENKKSVLRTLENLIPKMTDLELAQLTGFGMGLAAREDRAGENADIQPALAGGQNAV